MAIPANSCIDYSKSNIKMKYYPARYDVGGLRVAVGENVVVSFAAISCFEFSNSDSDVR